MRRAVVLALLLSACPGTGARVGGPPLPERELSARPALNELRAGRFAEAGAAAAQVLAADRDNPYAQLVSAISRYKAAMHQLRADVMTVLLTVFRGSVNWRYLRWALEQAERELQAVDESLALAARFPELAVELCLACWQTVDWNGDGRIDPRDQRFLEIERDANDREIPEGDPRRRPTFRFDLGDVHWARAFVAFQRAVLDLALAYRWSDAQPLIDRAQRDGLRGAVSIALEHPERIEAARQRILDGLDAADAARRAYLAEADDDREWVPSPRQRSHPLPLPVDDALYRTWEQITGDLRRLVTSNEGLSVAELAQLGDHQWQRPPGGYLDLGRLLSRPRAISIDLSTVTSFTERRERDRETSPEPVLRAFLGDSYRDRMKPSPLIGRLRRMKEEVRGGKESFERKLRYLFWIN